MSYRPRKVGMYWPLVFPGSVVMFVLGLCDVAVWPSSLVDYGPGDVYIIAQGPEKHFLPWV